jgi:hypothetical protein
MSVSRSPVSVVCTVLNDTAGLREMIDSLREQTRAPDEIVIADGGSDPHALEEIREIARSYPRAKVVAGARCTIADGRNRAIRAARHDIIACIDAGCRAEPQWLERLTAPFRDPRIDVVGGAYRVAGQTAFERLAGLITMPGALRPVDPMRFNPSARSIAFRRRVWERAFGFPHWLQTAEDTLFDLKLRSLVPRVGYAFAENAVVEWRPRTGPIALLRQFRSYERGEAHIGRGGPAQRYRTGRYLALMLWTAVAFGWASLYGGQFGLLVVAMLTLLFAKPHHQAAALAARSVRRAALANAHDRASGGAAAGVTAWLASWLPAGATYFGALALGELVLLGRWLGYRRGRRDRLATPKVYVDRLRDYFGRDTAEGHVPPWMIHATPAPRTLIVSWHWPPASRASANVLGSLFASASGQGFRVLTRAVKEPPAGARTPCPAIPVDTVPWPMPDDRPVRLWTLLADLLTTWRMIRAADRIAPTWPVDRVLAVYPYRFGLLAGAIIARRLGVPLVTYMHDLCSESLLTRSSVRRWLWRVIDGRILRQAWLTLVPTREFAAHYAQRGVDRLSVLPHCVPPDAQAASAPAPSDSLRLVYSGAVYEAHEDAVAALIRACGAAPGVDLKFQSPPHPLLVGQNAAWLPRAAAMAALADADVCVVALGFATPYPAEVQGCFPSKIVDYLAVGRPILAVVPEGCFVARFIRESGCGEVVTSRDAGVLHAAIDRLRDPARRAALAAATRQTAATLDGEFWFSELRRRLAFGAEVAGPWDAAGVPAELATPAARSTAECTRPMAHFDVTTT